MSLAQLRCIRFPDHFLLSIVWVAWLKGFWEFEYLRHEHNNIIINFSWRFDGSFLIHNCSRKINFMCILFEFYFQSSHRHCIPNIIYWGLIDWELISHPRYFRTNILAIVTMAAMTMIDAIVTYTRISSLFWFRFFNAASSAVLISLGSLSCCLGYNQNRLFSPRGYFKLILSSSSTCLAFLL